MVDYQKHHEEHRLSDLSDADDSNLKARPRIDFSSILDTVRRLGCATVATLARACNCSCPAFLDIPPCCPEAGPCDRACRRRPVLSSPTRVTVTAVGAKLARARSGGGRVRTCPCVQWQLVTSPPLVHPASRLGKCDGGLQHGSISFNLQGRQAKSFTGGPKAYLNSISGFVVVKENDHKAKLWSRAFAWTSGLALTAETRWPGRRHEPPR
jgi:hypothetical protein